MKPGIDKIKGFGEIQRAYTWGISFIGDTPNWGKAAGINGTTHLYRCNSLQLPDIANRMLEVNIRGVRVYQPGTTNYGGDVTMTFVESESAEIRRLLALWSNAQHDNKTESFGHAPIRDRSGKPGSVVSFMVYQLSVDGATATAKYQLDRCFLKGYSFGKFGSESESQILTATVSVSRIFPYSTGEVIDDKPRGRSYADDIISGIKGLFS